ncbi:MAG: acetamidase/formamidase family protein [Candidatus Latescibacteria bacterium]|nr:acetamidase/formamidase family protein [Candidatus Latescibacterota bacterium]
MRRFTRTPYFKGPDDPERKELRGTLQLGETVVVETVGGHDQDYEKIGRLLPGDVMEVRPPRQSRPGGLFFIEGIRAGDWVAIQILAMEVGPYGFYRNGGPHWGSIRLIAPVRDGLVHFPPDFVVPVRPMIGYINLASVDPFEIDHGGNLDFNAVQPGSTIHLRAQKDGGLLYLGDVHARMGDGELTGTGVEIDSAVTLKVDRSPGFPTSSPVVEKTRVVESAEEFLTSGQGEDWEEALKMAWSDMVSLIAHHYNTTSEYANLIVGTIADARPGYSAGGLNMRGRPGGRYVTCQLAVTKELRRTGKPYTP